jgi:aminoglycoside phosphotransferase (APT) family kinase protein
MCNYKITQQGDISQLVVENGYGERVDNADERLDALLRTDAVALAGDPTLRESYSNDTWLARTADGEDVVLRVCWIGDRRRLLREAAVGARLPPEVGYPTVLDSGTLRYDGETITWMVSRRLAGTSLIRAWPDLDRRRRDQALRGVLAPLRALHGWRPPAELLGWFTPPPPTDDPDAVVGSTLIPLPLDRVRLLLAPAITRAPEHRPVLEEAWHWLVENADAVPRLDELATGVVAHGDLHLDNVWWDGERVAGLLDLEWTRLGPPWLDLAQIRDNAVLAGEDTPDTVSDEAHAQLLAIATAGEPWAGVPDLVRRLTTVELAHQLRQVLVWGPPGAEPGVDHPVRQLRRLLDLV